MTCEEINVTPPMSPTSGELVRLLLRAVKRLEVINKLAVKDGLKIREKRQQELELWRKCVCRHINLTSMYLRHEFYGNAEKSTTNGYTCMHHALGAKCNHEHVFEKSHKLGLALTFHVIFAKVVEFHSATFVKEEEGILGSELKSMLRLASLTGLEILHCVKHTGRGW
jgi:hypothetical protein